MIRYCIALIVLSLPKVACSVEIDGRVDAIEWQGAQHVTDFRLTQPLSRQPAPLATEAWILATDKGLAVAFRNAQPATVPRHRQRGQRDNVGAVDRVNLFVDFDGEARIAYNFTVSLANSINDITITNENQFNDDWDGTWSHATSEDEEAWYVEMLVPWHVAPMQDGMGGQRTMGVSLDRVISETGQRMSWPAITFSEPRFLSVLAKVTVPEYGQSLLAVTPYISGVYDNVGSRGDFDGGADVFWKPNGRFQLSGTLNPDFGQVESDELVVNFSATETFFSDKRPFFTESQAFFDVPFGSLNQRSRLIYTRRVGAANDDGRGSGDVTAAVKLNGSAGSINYGMFAATEGGDVGRDFYAIRATRDFEGQGLGGMATRVERPFLGRSANIYEVDHRWANDRWNVRSTLISSQIATGGDNVQDSGAQIIVDYDMQNSWRQQLYALHIGRDLQLSDFGYLERNSFNYLRYEIGRRINDLPVASAYSGTEWTYVLARRANDQGDLINYAAQVNREGQRRDGGNDTFEIAVFGAGIDDLITRGDGNVRVPEKLFLNYERFFARAGAWEHFINAQYASEGLGGMDDGKSTLTWEPTYFVNDRLSVSSTLSLAHNPDWLLWRNDNALTTYHSDQLYLSSGLTWLIDDTQELRVRLEAIGLDAEVIRNWRVAPDGDPVASDEATSDFALRNLGFQVRYRYEFSPLSYLYVAYVRGGSLFQEGTSDAFDVGDEFRNAFDLRDSEQLLLKLSYRFEI